VSIRDLPPTRPLAGALGVGLALLLLAAAAAAARPVHAASPAFTVDTLTDGHLDAGATTCASAAAGGRCTLRAALELNEGNGGGGTVKIGAGQVQLTLGQLVISRDATIAGAGQTKSAVAGDGAHRVFLINTVFDGAALVVPHVAMTGLAITGGRALDRGLNGTNGTGGGILNFGTLTLIGVDVRGNAAYFGGGIGDVGNLSLQGATVRENRAPALLLDPRDPTSFGGGTGGGIDELGRLTVAGSLLQANAADTDGGNLTLDLGSQRDLRGITGMGSAAVTGTTIADGAAAFGGGVSVAGHASSFTASTFAGNVARFSAGGLGGAIAVGCTDLTLRNDTLSGNSAVDGVGGAIFLACGSNLPGIGTPARAGAALPATQGLQMQVEPPARHASATLDFVTIAGNSASRSGGAGIAAEGNTSTFAVHDTILADAAGGANCAILQSGTITSMGYDLEDASDCGFAKTGDQSGTNPRLGALGDNGGPTRTMALAAGSPALDAADPICDVTTDQRGVARPQRTRCDIGAFELQPAATQSPTPSPTALPAPPVTGAAGPASGAPLALLALVALPLLGVVLLVRRRRRA
jgi:hypothetical protein